MGFEEAVRESGSSVLIDIEVTPGSKVLQVPSGYNEWRKRIEVKLSQNAQKGKANEQLIGEISSLFRIPGSRVSIESGSLNSKKTVMIKDIGRNDVIEVFRKMLERSRSPTAKKSILQPFQTAGKCFQRTVPVSLCHLRYQDLLSGALHTLR